MFLLTLAHPQNEERYIPNQFACYVSVDYRKILKICPGAYIFQRPFLRGLFLEGLIYGGKFASQNRLS